MRRCGPSIFMFASFAACFSTHAADEKIKPDQLEFFEKKVRPILVERCYSCHSEKAEKIKGGLLLDTKEGWTRGGDTGPSIVPGDVDKSLLIQAVRYESPDLEMPPKGKMPAEEIEVLEKWVKMGAPDPRTGEAKKSSKGIDLEAGRKHWAYQPLKKPAVPGVKEAAWPLGEIDRFILAKLEASGMKPAHDADRVTLVRRVYFDLIGLPPTPEQIDAFVEASKKDAADAMEKLVDELLASPRFGERWGRHWLDVARFAESLTLRGFVFKDTWRYRDYVIESFNEDRPFNLFMQEQVAGDLMASANVDERRRQVAATAFLAMGNTNLEEQDKKQLVMDVVDEQIDTIGRAFLAQTIGCARCHDHKFDPIPARDYYALAGIFKSTESLTHANVSAWIETPLPMDEAREAAVKKHEALVAAAQAKLKDAKATLATATKKKDAGTKPGPATVLALKDLPGIIVDDAQAKKVGSWVHSVHVTTYIGDGYLHDDNKGKGEKTLTFQPELTEPGKYEVRISYTTGPSRSTKVPVTVFSADGEKTVEVNMQEPPLADGRWFSLGVYTFERNGQGFVIVSNEGTNGHVIADAVQFLRVDKPDSDAKKPAGVVKTAKSDVKPTTDAKETKKARSNKESAKELRTDDAASEIAALNASVKQIEAEIKELTAKGPKRDLITSIRESKEIGDTKIHIRGSVHTLGETAPRGFMQVVPVSENIAIPADQSGRLELGRWLAHRDNPLPARVMANRVWHWLIGQGLVRTVDNFGFTGESPSHPELLDHLATQFVENGWSTKKLIRQIVLSRTYQLSSTVSPSQISNLKSEISDLKSPDPDNRLLAHMNRKRLEAECIRDAMLQVSGKLDLTMGGPTYKPGLSSDFNYKHTDTRRGVYAPVFRNTLPELFEVFDFADPSVSTGSRNTSTVAPQALFMLNHPSVAEQANAAAASLLADKERTTDEARIARAYRLTLGRPPSARETAIAGEFLREAASGKQDAVNAWAGLFQALFASMDFRYVE